MGKCHLFLVSSCVCGSGLGRPLFVICINLSTFGVPVQCHERGFYAPSHLSRKTSDSVCEMSSSLRSSTRQPVVDLHSKEPQVSCRVVFEHCSLITWQAREQCLLTSELAVAAIFTQSSGLRPIHDVVPFCFLELSCAYLLSFVRLNRKIVISVNIGDIVNLTPFPLPLERGFQEETWQQCLEEMLQEARYSRSAGAAGPWLWAPEVVSSSADGGSLPWSLCCYQITALKACQNSPASLGFPLFLADVLVVRRGRLDGYF